MLFYHEEGQVPTRAPALEFTQQGTLPLKVSFSHLGTCSRSLRLSPFKVTLHAPDGIPAAALQF